MTIGDIENIRKIGTLDDDYLYFVIDNSGLFGICDKEGNILLRELFNDIIAYKDNNVLLALRDNGEYSIIKREKETLILDKKSYAYHEEYDGYLILSWAQHYGEVLHRLIMDKDGNVILNEDSIQDITYLEEDMFFIKQDNTWKCFNAITKRSFILDVKNYNNYSGGYMLQKYYDKYRYLDKNGVIRFDYDFNDCYVEYDTATSFHKSYPSGTYTAIVKKDNGLSDIVIDNNGKELFLVSPFWNITSTDYDVFVVEDIFNDKFGIVNLQGNIIIPCTYKKIEVTSNGICFCYDENNAINYFNSNGDKLAINEKLKYIDFLSNHEVITVLIDDKYAFMNKDGKILFNGFTFDKIETVLPNSSRLIASRKDISYEYNNPYKYTTYSIIDINKKKIIFTYSTNNMDKDNIDSLFTYDHIFYIAKLKEKNRYLLLDENGKKLYYFYSETKPLIKNDLIITSIFGQKHIDKCNNLIYVNDDINDYGFNDIDIISDNLLIITSRERRYICEISENNKSLSLIFKKDITFEKGIINKIRRRLVSR